MITDTDHHSSTACPCGCAPCDDTCCELECQHRPRFFCGQLLTDEDLSSMVDWAAAKFRLQRFRTGWGVACGLEVTCDHDNPQGVIVGEGYAVSCCGDDIVVCKDTPLDLSDACRDEDPCADPAAVVKAAADSRRYREREKLIDELRQDQYSDQATADAVVEAMRNELADDGTDGGHREDPDVRWVDVFVRYAEEDADLRATHGHTECAAGPDCEPAKVRETSELHWVRGAPRPDKVAVGAWCADYEKCLDVLRRYQRQVGADNDLATARAWLLRWVEQHPPTVFCNLRDLICDLSDNELAGRLVEILAKLVVDCRIAHTRGDCHTCECDQGVRLARVYLGPATPGGECRVLYIDGFPPYRRPLAREEAPALLGTVNVGSLIGAEWRQACQRLADLGVRAQPMPLDDIGGVGDLLARLDCGCTGPIVPCGDEVGVLIAEFDDVIPRGWSVVGFCREGSWHGNEEGYDKVEEYDKAAEYQTPPTGIDEQYLKESYEEEKRAVVEADPQRTAILEAERNERIDAEREKALAAAAKAEAERQAAVEIAAKAEAERQAAVETAAKAEAERQVRAEAGAERKAAIEAATKADAERQAALEAAAKAEAERQARIKAAAAEAGREAGLSVEAGREAGLSVEAGREAGLSVDAGAAVAPGGDATREARLERVVSRPAPVAVEDVRVAEIDKLKELRGVGSVIAERLVDSGLTVEAVAAEEPALAIVKVEEALPASHKWRAPRVVEEVERLVGERGLKAR